ncbi:MAG: BLUF domain-containing protein [Pseudomonadota bacterium]
MFTSLVYVSSPVEELSDIALAELWESSTKRNEESKITGALYFGGDIFFQVIEGPDEAVLGLFEAISRDDRHKDVDILAENDVASPAFRMWPMKLIDGRNSRVLKMKFDPRKLREMAPAKLSRLSFHLATL